MAKKENNFFEILNSISSKEKIKLYKKDINGYLLSMFLSHDMELLDIINKINPFIFKLSNEVIYQYFFHAVPKKKRYLKWTKKEELNKDVKKQLKELCEEFEISEQEARLSLR